MPVHHIAQEHSYVADMWQRISKPDVLIYLDVSYANSMQRRPMNWKEADFIEQVHRLQHARQHASLYIDSNELSPGEVLQKVIDYLTSNKSRSRQNWLGGPPAERSYPGQIKKLDNPLKQGYNAGLPAFGWYLFEFRRPISNVTTFSKISNSYHYYGRDCNLYSDPKQSRDSHSCAWE